jgi:GT2 family glycosyltransferase/lipopolysaccharide/colanic/teichoic acid biosynthesis glycosyltransferase
MGGHVAGLAPAARESPAESVGRAGATDVSIVIVSYNSRDAVSECLASLECGDSTVATETILVDNASSDGTPGVVRERFPWVRVTANTANLGYARAVNQGIGLSSGRYVLVLNPDVTVRRSSIGRLVRFMDGHGDAGISASKLLNPDGTLQYSCRRFYTFLTLLLRRSFLGRVFRNSRAVADYLMLDYDHEESRPVDWVIGACMMVRREALRDIGLMDERFFLYFEDVDWCYRTWQGGWRVYYVPESVMQHRHTRASAQIRLPRQVAAHALSLFHFYEKWGKAVYDVKRYKRVLSGALLLASDLIAVNGSFAVAYALRSSLGRLLQKPMFGVSVYTPFLVFANIVVVLTFAFLELYSARAGREAGPDLFVRILRATMISAIVLMASTFLTSQVLYSRVLVGTFCVLVVALTAGFRMLLRLLHRRIHAGRFDLERIAIVGTGPPAERLAARIRARRDLGYDVAGFVDRGGDPPPSSDVPVIGKLRDLPGLIERHRIGEVIFSDPDLPADEVADFLLKARRSAVDVRMVSGLSDLLTRRARVEEFLDLPVITFEREALFRAGAGVKRALDAAAAAGLIVLWSPALGVSALLSAMRGSAPLGTVERAGLGGRTYRMYVLPDRTTPPAFRRFTSRHGLVSFPALLNVLRGEMSLVGPSPAEAGSLDSFDARERLRFDARPGIAGPSQLSTLDGAPANGTPAALDAYYVQNWSLGGDLRVLLAWLARCVAGRLGEPRAVRGASRAVRPSQEG